MLRVQDVDHIIIFCQCATQWLSCKTATTQPDLPERRMDYVFQSCDELATCSG